MCCADWSRDESDLQNYWQYADSPAMNCDWFCEDCPEARDHEEKEANGKPEADGEMNCPIACVGEVPLIIILIFGGVFCCMISPFYFVLCSRPSSTSSTFPTESTTESSWSPPWSPPRPPTPPPQLVNQPAMPPPPPPPPMAGATIQSYEDLPPPPAYESS